MHTPANDPRLVWQGQGRERPLISVEELRLIAQIAGRKMWRNLVIASALTLLLLVMCSLALISFSSTPVRMLAAAMMLLTVVVVCKAWYRMWRHTLSPNVASAGCVEFYRQELLAQYRSAAITWRLIMPVVIFAFLMWNAVFRTNLFVPKILLPSVLVLLFFVRRRNVRQLKRKLSILDTVEEKNSQ